MTNTKWLRRALLGGVAMTVMAASAQADEISDLKAQLEALQSRVSTMEAAPAPMLPEGATFITMRRGVSEDVNANLTNKEFKYDTSRGLTFSVAPTADLPVPETTVAITGWARTITTVSGDRGIDGNGDPANNGGGLNPANIFEGTGSSVNINATGQFRITANTETAIGAIGTVLEFRASNNGGALSARHMYGTWQMTPDWQLLIGNSTYIGALALPGVATVETEGPAGPTASRAPQIRLTYNGGPLRFQVGIQDPTDPTGNDTADYPNFAMNARYTMAGGHAVEVAATVADYTNTLRKSLGYAVGGGVRINLGDIAEFNAGAMFGRGEVLRFLASENIGQGVGGSAAVYNTNNRANKAWGFNAGLSFDVSETTTLNAAFGYVDDLEKSRAVAGGTDKVMSVQANLMWQPVSQMRMGWGVKWAREKLNNGAVSKDIQGAFGAWFSF